MTNFTLKLIEIPNTSDFVYKLLIDDNCPLDDFWKEIEELGNFQKELDKIQTIITFLAQDVRLPSKQFQELKHRSKDDKHKDFEIRTKRLRVYLFQEEETGKIIVLGELKKGNKTQKKAIAKMRKIKLAYFERKS